MEKRRTQLSALPTKRPLSPTVEGDQADDAGSCGEKQKRDGFAFDDILTDRGYDADALLKFITEKGAKVITPPRKNRIDQRATDWYTYKERNLVEQFINKIKQYRCLFTRYEKYASRYMAFLSFVAMIPKSSVFGRVS